MKGYCHSLPCRILQTNGETYRGSFHYGIYEQTLCDKGQTCISAQTGRVQSLKKWRGCDSSWIVRGICHGNFSLATSYREPALFSSVCNSIGSRTAPRLCHMGTGTPASSDDVVVIHAADNSLSGILCNPPPGKAHHAWSWARNVRWQRWRCRRPQVKTIRLLRAMVTTRACHLMSQWRPTWQLEPWLASWSTRWCTPWTPSR